MVSNFSFFMKKLFSLLLFSFSFIAFSQSTEKIDRIDSVLNYLHQRQLFNGTVLIGDRGKVLYKKAFGVKHPTSGEALTTASSFNLASVSKQFYTMMIMILKEQGKLRYDDAVQKYLPIFPYANITIRHLMNQVSGLPEYFDMAGGNMNLLDTLTNQSMLELLSAKNPPLVFQPGEKWEYSNTNYTTLASVLEKVSGTTADKFFQQHIAKPLKMTNSYVYNLKLKSYPTSRVFGFRYEGGKPVLNDLVRFDGIVGDGNVYSSAEDLYKWDQSLYTEKLVKKSTFEEAITPGKLNSGEETKYGFGWGIIEPGKVVAHSGGWVGFSTYIIRYLDKNQVLVILTNGSDGRGGGMVRNIWEGKPVTLPITHLITNVQLVNGTGMPAKAAHVRIINNRIHDVGALTPFPGEAVTDGKGNILAPGFIDSHSHHDWGLRENPSCLSATNQGITTIVVGQDGGSMPIDSIQSMIKETPVSVNIASYTGHSTLRKEAMKGDVLRKGKPEEIAAMKVLLEAELDKGSFGLSTGLEYESAFYSNRDEVVELAKVAAAKGGRYISHIRSEDIDLDEALDEIVSIGREAKIPVQISHFKIALRSKWGTSAMLIARLQRARQSGVDVTADVYPYTMWSSTPRVLFPKKDFDNLKSAQFATEELFDPSASVMVSYPANKNLEGKSVAEIGKVNNESPAQTLLRIIHDGSKPGMGSAIVATSMSEADVANFINWEHSNICSDGTTDGHPRGHGAFTRVLGGYVREQNLMPIEKAIYKMTGLTAEHMGIRSRGLIMPGYFADLVLFDPATVSDNATIDNPKAISTGIEKVWVNGQVVYESGQPVANYPGVFIRR